MHSKSPIHPIHKISFHSLQQHTMEISDSNQNQIQKWCCFQTLHQFHGFWFPEDYLKPTQQVLENFKPLSNDIILASFPKTGTTWLKSLLFAITNRTSTDYKTILKSNHPHDLVSSLETKLFLTENFTTPQNDKNDTTRIFGTHIPYKLFSKNLNSSDCKIVYATRNPKDTLISLWHFLQKSEFFEQDPWDLKTAVDQFCEGVLSYGPYYDHVLEYREESLKRPEKVFFVTYEDLKENPGKCVKEMGEFLECPFEESEEGRLEIEEIVKCCSFESLSKHEVNKTSELLVDFPLPCNAFFRKGEIGDNLNFLDDEMIQQIDGVTKDKFHKSGFVYGV